MEARAHCRHVETQTPSGLPEPSTGGGKGVINRYNFDKTSVFLMKGYDSLSKTKKNKISDFSQEKCQFWIWAWCSIDASLRNPKSWKFFWAQGQEPPQPKVQKGHFSKVTGHFWKREEGIRSGGRNTICKNMCFSMTGGTFWKSQFPNVLPS